MPQECCHVLAGMTSENVAERYGITRAQQDELAARSHNRAAAAQASGRFADEIVPVKTTWKDPKTVRALSSHLLCSSWCWCMCCTIPCCSWCACMCHTIPCCSWCWCMRYNILDTLVGIIAFVNL